MAHVSPTSPLPRQAPEGKLFPDTPHNAAVQTLIHLAEQLLEEVEPIPDGIFKGARFVLITEKEVAAMAALRFEGEATT